LAKGKLAVNHGIIVLDSSYKEKENPMTSAMKNMSPGILVRVVHWNKRLGAWTDSILPAKYISWRDRHSRDITVSLVSINAVFGLEDLIGFILKMWDKYHS
jgi:hypothetical protein